MRQLLLVLLAAFAMKAAEWGGVRGVNFVPSNAASPQEMWLRFDPAVNDRELGWARGLGFNSVRVFLSFEAWEKNPARFSRELGAFFDLASKHQISVLPVLFDNCGIEARADAVPMTVHQAYRHYLEDPKLTEAQKKVVISRYREFAEGRGKEMWLKVGRDTPFDILFWQLWQPNPGLSRMDQKDWPKLERYTDAVVAAIQNRTNLVALEIMNEPGTVMDLRSLSREQAETRTRGLLDHIAGHCRRKYPKTLLTIGCENLARLKSTAGLVGLLSIHSYKFNGELLQDLDDSKQFAAQQKKPILLTECLANTDNWLKIHGEEKRSTDEAQLRHYQEMLPIILNSGMGWYSFGFIAGQMFAPFTDILYPNGYRRPAAVYLEEQLRKAPN